MNNDYDIVVVGASTTGAYYARKMAEKGLRVLVIEKDTRRPAAAKEERLKNGII